jgi:hypothetical protein
MLSRGVHTPMHLVGEALADHRPANRVLRAAQAQLEIGVQLRPLTLLAAEDAAPRRRPPRRREVARRAQRVFAGQGRELVATGLALVQAIAEVAAVVREPADAAVLRLVRSGGEGLAAVDAGTVMKAHEPYISSRGAV